ncbi:hypothetical protein [Actinoallomurus sp. NPDC052274]|uniref:hypothetical protein n=1 Tax=Actinoallomurus sp. NPDC052274 TaxID=3155420 RepID=UPI00342E359A
MTVSDETKQLGDLQAKWGRSWRIWRGRRTSDIDDERTGAWIASRINPTAGPDPTVMRDTPSDLNEALHMQLMLIDQGRKPLTVSEMGPE